MKGFRKDRPERERGNARGKERPAACERSRKTRDVILRVSGTCTVVFSDAVAGTATGIRWSRSVSSQRPAHAGGPGRRAEPQNPLPGSP